MARLFLKVFEKADFEKASDGYIVGGHITFNGNQQAGVVQLGKEVIDAQEYKDKNTQYRKFIKCNIGISETTEDAYDKIYTNEIDGTHTITIFY